MSWIDDVINVADHRLSTGQMEEVLSSDPDVAECAVVGVADDFKGEIPIGFAVLKAGVDRSHEDIAAEWWPSSASASARSPHSGR
jgi:propionyl-CoA synthetase